jgi:hypothetical protein
MEASMQGKGAKMRRTTPPPPLDITAVFPELGRLARRTVRLHPRAGAPGPGDSSLGGPLLWPAGEPWPTCQGPHVHDSRRRLPPPVPPFPMIGVLQVSAGDVPSLPFPEATDLLQVLWCPNEHDEPWWGPRPVTVWRRAGTLAESLLAPPEPQFDGERCAQNYVPLPCVLHPEPYIEHPHPADLPGGLATRVLDWDDRHDWRYETELSTAPGTKIGGYPDWIQAPEWPVCDCGRRMEHLLTIASEEPHLVPGGEPHGYRWRWLPLEDRPDGRGVTQRAAGSRDRWAPHGLMLGDVGSLYLFTCTVCADRPLAGTMQCS